MLFRSDGEQQPFVKGHIFCIKQDAEGNLWIGTSQGVYCYKDGRESGSDKGCVETF